MNSVASFWRLWTARVPGIIAHRYFFYGVVLVFCISAVWLAVSVTYPMIFDEEYHLGIIDIYSRQLSPFIAVQPPEAAVYGDITRYNSYLYHYLASFPYRLAKLFTSDIQTLTILLRLLSVATVVAALFMYRWVLLLAKLPRAVVHFTLLLFVATPLVPFVSAHVSYDPVTLLLVPAMAYCLLRAIQKEDWAGWLLGLVSLGMLATLVKFTMLPIFAVFLLIAGVVLVRQHKTKIFTDFIDSFKKLRFGVKGVLIVLLVISFGLFAERYGGNLLRYHSLTPDCSQVQSRETCLQYSPWARNDTLLAQQKIEPKAVNNPLLYTVVNWLPQIINDLFITAAYPPTGALALHQGTPQNLHAAAGHPVLRCIGWSILLGGAVLVWLFRRQLKYHLPLLFILAGGAIYTIALWWRNYSEYSLFAVPVAIQGRYFIPLLPFLLALIVLAASRVLKRRSIKAVIATGLIVAGVFGSGALTYIFYSETDWHWPAMRQANEFLQTVVHYMK
ncbi:MAG TPA: glycosyltransferase family 39 protein [Verrucomicrobiae bacterium]|nr:glycosyltransferase family 39 protein [Verrucomicrobiae bacterium]